MENHINTQPKLDLELSDSNNTNGTSSENDDISSACFLYKNRHTLYIPILIDNLAPLHTQIHNINYNKPFQHVCRVC